MIFLSTQSEEKLQGYTKYLIAIGAFSNLFSSSVKPYVQYRVAENIFCKAFDAENLARADVAYDAIINNIGIGIKTFILNGNSKIEKVAEFNSYSSELRQLSGIELAQRLAHYRNERITFADRLYNLNDRIYHIIGRDDYKIKVFETRYDLIDTETIQIIDENRSSLKFRDKDNEYNFNFSKSVLMKRFIVPNDAIELDINIISEPIDVLLRLFDDYVIQGGVFNSILDDASISTSDITELVPGEDYVILPLYTIRNKQLNKPPFVPEKSQLNQWNAGGRERNAGEVYISIPIQIHQMFPDFFPSRDCSFNLRLPSREIIVAKVCQANGKALMTNPNNAMADWMLRRILRLAPFELLTYDKLIESGFDSVKITKIDNSNYLIDFAPVDSYEEFIN